MSKFNVGDKVRIRSDRGDGWNFDGKMDKWCGKVMTIREIIGCFYSMEEDTLEHNGMGWRWSDDDIVEKITTPKYKVGDKVRVRKDLVVGKDYGKVTLLDGMAEYCGKTLTVRSIINDDYECSNGFYYNELMLEPDCKFKVGDYVICNTNDFWCCDKGWIGQVTKVHSDGRITMRGRRNTLTTRHPEYFNLYTKDQPTKIVITTDGKTTTAKMYRGKSVVKVETTKCHPDDRFDFMVGARVAFDRLVGEDEKKEAPKGTLKIEIGKKYKLKDYDKVSNHIGFSSENWRELQEEGAVTVRSKDRDGDYLCSTPKRTLVFFSHEAFECEWEEPISVNGFKVGDTVKVIDTGYQYSTYREWVKKHISDEYDMFSYDIDNKADKSHTFTVMAIHEHIEWSNRILAYIKDTETGRCYLIEIKGLERVS